MTRYSLGSHENTAHVWAQNSQIEGHAGDRRMFFERGTLYSYGRHFAIASHTLDKNSKPVILFTTDRYSVSTSKHISLTRRALRPDIPVFYVPNAQPGYEKENIRAMQAEIKQKIEAYVKPRIKQSTRDSIAAEISQITERMNKFGAAFVKGYRAVAVPDDISKLADKMRKATEARARAENRAREKAKEDKRILAAQELGIPCEQWAEAWRQNREELHATHSYTIKDYIREKCGTLMRLQKDGETILTSEGAEFPASHGKRAFKKILECRETKTPWQRNGHTIHLGAFQIDSIDDAGNVVAGCHKVLFPEIELMSKTLGL